MRILITGGVKSGKSTRALELAMDFPEPRYFVATATAFDEEMREKIKKHKDDRADRFITIEEPFDITKSIENNMILDCVPLWLNNMFYEGRESEIDGILESFIERLPKNAVIVTNETGMGVIPADPLSRRFGNKLGSVNATLAKAVDRVELLISGIALRIK
jgi:adenosylcobinamide kinase/adenosylcobinamide-phosphate guanylyltransferase